eukprot:4172016-Karenia_brevis.AAC.1
MFKVVTIPLRGHPDVYKKQFGLKVIPISLLPSQAYLFKMRTVTDYRKHDIKWHKTDMCRLRLVSFAAEAFWRIAFKERAGMNVLTWMMVRYVIISGVIIDGRHYSEAQIYLFEMDSVLALKIARGAVESLQKLHYRFLDAIVPQLGGGEHDIIAERDGLPGRSCIEVKCKQINKPDSLLST